jgi:ABC-type transport system substrate-binding protein
MPAASVLLIAMSVGGTASAKKPGGVLKMYSIDSPASMSLLEESTVFAEGPMMGVFNNLIMFDQDLKQNSLQSIVPDLVTSWSWNEEGTELTLPLRHGSNGTTTDPILDAQYRCGSNVNVNSYCDPEVDKLIEQQSIEGEPGRRKQLVWAIERKLVEDTARPIIFYNRYGTCWQPWVKGLTIMVNSLINGNRMEDVWLDK